ncbi:splicing factor YJU2 [Parastagonospora nodorum]|nr:splicing factor YJU2 [Parastagonospora nodorum]KAH4104406.1 splicing factor YJU2 [Parastagonospora nodorum]KAH4122011.1 splicing factor YJU2 [Parastagonospora nodorum]KAH4222739.1 splicing factor YJU2 [Parastagonospora nodorum]KAH4240663.1 splicing factor YJU2 [Parastagonospora nodorum]
MSERKVLSKYYPPDFDPSKITRTRGPKNAGPKVQTVRLMAPFSMKCTHCGEFIYKGRKFNARKETTEEKYYNIAIFRFYIRCTRCSGEITFKTDPKNMDYECERGAKRNFEPWREAKLAEETEEERLDRLEKEEAERDAMKELETKVLDAKTEMAIADALDEIRSRNARLEKADRDGVEAKIEPDPADDRRKRQEEEDAEAARQAFANRTMPDLGEKVIEEDMMDAPIEAPVATAFTKKPKEKKDFSAALGIKKKAAAPAVAPVMKTPAAPSKLSTMLVAGYDSDDD